MKKFNVLWNKFLSIILFNLLTGKKNIKVNNGLLEKRDKKKMKPTMWNQLESFEKLGFGFGILVWKT